MYKSQVVPFLIDALKIVSRKLSVLPDALGIPDISGSEYMAVLYGIAHAQENFVSLSSEHDL